MDVVLSEISGAVWQFEMVTQPSGDRVLWVTGLHWPGCDDASGHESCSLGQVRSDSQFQIANQEFWKTIFGEDLAALDAVFNAAERALTGGDVGDVRSGHDAPEAERELQ